MTCSLECCHTVTIRPFSQLFTVAIIYTDDMFRPKITRTFICCVSCTVVVLTCFVMCVCVCASVCVCVCVCVCV